MVAKDTAMVDSLRLFNDMQERRHAADYDHGERFAKWHLVQAVQVRPTSAVESDLFRDET